MKSILEKLEETTSYLKQNITITPSVGIVLGTGLNGLSNEIETNTEINYCDIPNFSLSTAESHSGKLLFGTLSGKNVVAMKGRFHYYEGFSMQEITFPIRALKAIGIETLIITNAAGSLNPLFKKGSIMIIDDYINLLGTTPLVGEWHPSMGPRTPDMSDPYSKRLISIIENIAMRNSIKIHRGVYSAMTGPCLETRAEYRMLKLIGADAIGMSTIPETIVAKQIGLETLGLSILTDECYPDALSPLTLDEIIAIANSAEPQLSLLVKELLLEI
jgi:purine-nucleoside phosphorylase